MGFFDDLFEGFGGHRRRRGGHYNDHDYDDDHEHHHHHHYDPRYPPYDRDPYRQPGYDPQAAQRILVCPTCGSENSVKAKFCMECGQPLRPSSSPKVSYSEKLEP